MDNIDDQGRPEPPVAADEAGTLIGFLEYQRATFEWKCRDLDAAGLQTRVAASELTLGGMMKHLALVEQNWFCRSLHGREWTAPWDTVDWKADRDWEFHSAADDAPAELWSLWRAEVDRARRALDEALASGGLDQLAARAWPDGRSPSLR